MNRTHRSITRIFKRSKSAIDDVDDLPAVEKSFRSSSFALLPSAVTPSRAPSNTFIASIRAALFEPLVRFHIPYGQDKWPEVIDWYNNYGSKDSTAIDKIQLRKNYQHPYYHEYIVISTRGGHTYRIDRRPDADAAFDTIMKEGCTAYDTIEEVDSAALKEVYETSECVVELHWRGEQTIELLSVFAICFRIHNDKWAKRYTLQHYNCYFLSWTIIMIVVRNATACEANLNAALEHGIWRVQRGVWSVERALEAERVLKTKRIQDGKPEWGLKLEREWEKQLELEWAPKVGRAEERALKQAQERALDLARELARDREHEHKLERVQAWERKVAQSLAPVLSQMPLVLGWQLAQGWKDKGENVRENLPLLLRNADSMFLAAQMDILAKTDLDRFELSESVSVVMIQMMEDAKGDICNALSDLAEFPASFSVSLNNDSNPVKSNTAISTLYRVTHTQLERHLIDVVENHAVRVARWGLGSRAEVKSSILDGMWRAWQNNVSHLSLHISFQDMVPECYHKAIRFPNWVGRAW